MSDVSAIIIHIGKFSLQIQQSILVWLGICVFFAFFFYFAGKKIEKLVKGLCIFVRRSTT